MDRIAVLSVFMHLTTYAGIVVFINRRMEGFFRAALADNTVLPLLSFGLRLDFYPRLMSSLLHYCILLILQQKLLCACIKSPTADHETNINLNLDHASCAAQASGLLSVDQLPCG